MGCHHSSQEENVLNRTSTSSKKHIYTKKRNDRVSGREDITSDLVQHTRVDDISEIFVFHNVIGTGHFGCVKRATSIKSGKEWAVKEVKLNNEVDRDALRNEISILRRLHHPHIVRVIASYEDKEHMYMVMQLVKGSELYDHVYKHQHQYEQDDVRRIIRALLRAVAFLHSNMITHRDLKLENLLLENVSNPTSLKLCDFGLSTRFRKGEKMVKSLGTIDYVAPEVLDGDYNEKCDLWSVGVICYELLTGISPFHMPTVDETIGKIYDGVLVFDDSTWKKYSPKAINFIKMLVKEDVDARLSAEQALNHPWLMDLENREHSTPEQMNRLKSDKRHLLTNMLSFSKCRKMKQTALLSVALGVSEDHIHQEMAAEVFHSMDQNKTGTLTKQEFCSSLVECGISENVASDLFLRINQSKSGSINFLEFLAAVMDQEEIGLNTMKEAFSLLDGEKKGRLSIVGLQDVFKNSLANEEVKEMIASVDTKGSGYVEFTEFQQMFNKTTTIEEEGSESPCSTTHPSISTNIIEDESKPIQPSEIKIEENILVDGSKENNVV